MFNSYVKLPEGSSMGPNKHHVSCSLDSYILLLGDAILMVVVVANKLKLNIG